MPEPLQEPSQTKTPAQAAPSQAVDAQKVRDYFEARDVVDEYAQAALWIGLWESEKKIFEKTFAPHMRLLELGCGAGRIAIGLHRRGYRHIAGVDICAPMIEKARALAAQLEIPEENLSFQTADATDLKNFASGSFDGAIFGFNGLMQIPGHAQRQKAMTEIFRVLKKDARFVFTTHDRANPFWADFWKGETDRWATGTQDPALVDFGDRYYDSPLGKVFMHVPSREEILEMLTAAGFTHETDHTRSHLANEPLAVREFSDECRFWVARK